MIELPVDFVERMKVQLGDGFNDFMAVYSRTQERAIRVNTLKISVDRFKEISPFALLPVPWEPSGFFVDDPKPGKTVLHAAGAYYVQEPSAMSVVPELAVKEGESVLDLCSAPGGKGTQLAQYLNGSGLICLNEINFTRAKILSQNVERLGISNAVVTCAPPEKLAAQLGGYFDKVLVDAPCSGEGMFRKEENSIPEWSLKNIEFCAVRQRGILDCAAKLLKPGGLLAYSTCTFSPEEDEFQVENFLASHGNFSLIKQIKLYPHEIKGEGHFYAVFKKESGESSAVRLYAAKSPDKKNYEIYRRWALDTLCRDFGDLSDLNGTLCALPGNMPALDAQILRAGIRIGEITGGRFVPSHSLAMCMKHGEAKAFEVSEETAMTYLRGLTFECGEEDGWKLVEFHGLPLGWCKVTGGVAKNHLPKGLRI